MQISSRGMLGAALMALATALTACGGGGSAGTTGATGATGAASATAAGGERLKGVDTPSSVSIVTAKP